MEISTTTKKLEQEQELYLELQEIQIVLEEGKSKLERNCDLFKKIVHKLKGVLVVSLIPPDTL